VEADISNLFGFTLKDNIFEWDENFVQNHLSCMFEETEQVFHKWFWIMKNDNEVYMKLRNIQQQIIACV
jgi:hypothetical protein